MGLDVACYATALFEVDQPDLTEGRFETLA